MAKRNSLAYSLTHNKNVNTIENERTKKQYIEKIRMLAQFLKEECGIKRVEQLEGKEKEYLQTYERKLEADGKTPATIHTYMAACCKAVDVKLDEIDKPIRKASTIIRSRDANKNQQGKAEMEKEENQNLIRFQKAVGIRRDELKHLKKDNLKRDESGYLCVEVPKGKGGKYQLQRIAPENEELVKSYFDGSKDKVFTKEQMDNKIELHSLRSANAREKYDYYLKRIVKEPKYREQLRKECLDRFDARHKRDENYNSKRKRFIRDMDEGRPYVVRGDNRKIALEKGYPTEYNCLALMAVSIFHLSHWRTNVAVTNYMLAG
jgi:hypothetical protein